MISILQMTKTLFVKDICRERYHLVLFYIYGFSLC